jgi:hydrogenase nickel incorporation protein HypB
MCSTCGCADHAEPKITDLCSESHDHAHPISHYRHRHDDVHKYRHADGSEHTHHEADERSATQKAGLDESQSQRKERTLRIEQDILAKNNRCAERNRAWFNQRKILSFNVMSSPGAGKTTLLERTIRSIGSTYPISVIEGDQETTRDAERIRAAGGRVTQINTGSGCHLDAEMIAVAVQQLNPPPLSFLLIENVGNLVCPALFDLGESARLVVTSVTEGEDKPLKYPHMFRVADIVILNKIDLLPYVAFDVAAFGDYALKVNPKLSLILLSAARGDGMEGWYSWLHDQMKQLREASFHDVQGVPAHLREQ